MPNDARAHRDPSRSAGFRGQNDGEPPRHTLMLLAAGVAGAMLGAAAMMLLGDDREPDGSARTDGSTPTSAEPVGDRRGGPGDTGDSGDGGPAPAGGEDGVVLEGEHPAGRWEVSAPISVCAAFEYDGGGSESCDAAESESEPVMNVLDDIDENAIAVFGVAPEETVELRFDGAQPEEPEMGTLSDGRIVYLALLDSGQVPQAVSFVDDVGSVVATAEAENDVVD